MNGFEPPGTGLKSSLACWSGSLPCDRPRSPCGGDSLILLLALSVGWLTNAPWLALFARALCGVSATFLKWNALERLATLAGSSDWARFSSLCSAQP